jgi:hypothetical protein
MYVVVNYFLFDFLDVTKYGQTVSTFFKSYLPDGAIKNIKLVHFTLSHSCAILCLIELEQ